MSDTAIKVEDLGKLYKLGEITTGTISHDLKRWWASVRGKEDPYAKIGAINDRTSKGTDDYVWALKDVSFEIKKGEAVGIIGRNGAGKSTLLKLLSKVTAPTKGSIKLNGRLASLLEVGTGFHPELTGRENIFLNGAILGMTKAEIKRKFDEIVDFAGVEKYINTPVKRYSSGMYVRLAFAVAAHLESEILIVDEVLAVGDAEFQKKCLGKMGEVSKGEGRTVLFVSHNMAAVQGLCSLAILMDRGTVSDIGNVGAIIHKYTTAANSRNIWIGNKVLDGAQLHKVFVQSVSETPDTIYISDSIEIGIVIEITKQIPSMVVGFNIVSGFGYPIMRANYNDFNDLETLTPGYHKLSFLIPPYHLAVGQYSLALDISIPFVAKILNEDLPISFEVAAQGEFGNKFTVENSPQYNSIVRINIFKEYNNEKIYSKNDGC